MVGHYKGQLDPGCHHPGLWYKQEGCLNDRIVKCAWCPGVGPLLTPNLIELFPFAPVLSKIVDQRRPVVLLCDKDPPHILKEGNFLQGPPLCLKICFYSRTCLLLHPPPVSLMWPGNSHSVTTMIWTCHTVGTAVGVSSPPTVPLLCPARGGAQNGPGCRSDLRPPLGTPPLGMPHCALPKGRISYTSRALLWVGVTSQTPPYHPVLHLLMGYQ